MLLPKAPSWFVHKLREHNSSLGVAHSGTPQGWRITQKEPYYHDLGIWEGMHLREVRFKNKHIMYIPEIGSRVFAELEECWLPRFKSYEAYCKHFNILVG